MSSKLISTELVEAGDYEGVAAKIPATWELIRTIRGGK
jgi:hypothetical protein